MWKKPANPVPIDLSQVVEGLYVWLDVPWAEHPFLSPRLMVRTARDVALIQGTGAVGRIYYYPERSLVPLPPLGTPAQSPDSASARVQADEAAARKREVAALAMAKEASDRQYRAEMARIEKDWAQAARATREALLGLSQHPRTAGAQLEKLSQHTADTIHRADEVLLHLLSSQKGKGPQFHALNGMTLCMLVGKHAGLGAGELTDLAMGALAHDAGHAQVPQDILRTSRRKKFEEDFYRQHVKFSLDSASQSGVFTPQALAVIADHHEACDGSGWPKGRRETSVAARILQLVDRFDHLCTPETSDRPPLMPAEALAHMFRNDSQQLDAGLLALLVRLLGVYPPGTVVALSDGSLAQVVSPGPQSLQPRVLIYNPDLDKSTAPTVDLSAQDDLKIIEAIRPATLQADVLEWFNLNTRLSYHYSVRAVSA